ncbi:unnamed protein product [Haemonchus placei]|uniref:Uncharacterized protein n=1 Tax=Haemonchus placei TaxID=6290 RepID=A0A0N4WY75_HAEPC|nr:unnamed protein product [Haemonchus placei]
MENENKKESSGEPSLTFTLNVTVKRSIAIPTAVSACTAPLAIAVGRVADSFSTRRTAPPASETAPTRPLDITVSRFNLLVVHLALISMLLLERIDSLVSSSEAILFARVSVILRSYSSISFAARTFF